MSTMQRLTMIGLYDYDPTIFDKLELPEGYDKTTFVNSLLLEHGEKCVLYTDPDFMKNMIGVWSSKWNLELTRIYDALTAEYNPIYNYDRYETSKEGRGKKFNSEVNSGHKATDSPKYNDDITNDYDVVSTQQIDSVSEHKISADNSDTYQPERKDIDNLGQTTVANDGTIKRHIEGKTQDLSETANSKTKNDETENTSHEAHMYGNIGVTTSAAMVTEVVEQRIKYNLYSIACQLFAADLLIGIY